MQNETLVREIIMAILLKRYKMGRTEISLEMNDIMLYLPDLEKLFNEAGLSSELFIKTPISQVYDSYKSFLVSYILGMKLGSMSDDNNMLILSTDEYFMDAFLSCMEQYQSIIDRGCDIIDNKSEVKTLVNCIK